MMRLACDQCRKTAVELVPGTTAAGGGLYFVGHSISDGNPYVFCDVFCLEKWAAQQRALFGKLRVTS